MKLSVFTVLLQDRPFDEACAYLASRGVQAVEIGCGGFPGKAHCDPKKLLKDPAKIDALKATLDKYGLEIPRQPRASQQKAGENVPRGF